MKINSTKTKKQCGQEVEQTAWIPPSAKLREISQPSMTSKRPALQKKCFCTQFLKSGPSQWSWTVGYKLIQEPIWEYYCEQQTIRWDSFRYKCFIKSIALPDKHEWLINMPTYLCVGGDLMMVSYQEIFSLRIRRLKYSFKSERESQCWPSHQDETVYTAFLPKFSGEHWSNTEAVIAFSFFFPFFFIPN